MNAHTPAPAQAQALFANVPAAGSSLLSRLDCSVEENVKEARHQLRRCRTEREFADWAATWGENLCTAAESHSQFNPEEHVDIDEFNEVEKDNKRMEDAIHAAVKALDKFGDPLSDGQQNELAAITGDLENALEG